MLVSRMALMPRLTWMGIDDTTEPITITVGNLICVGFILLILIFSLIGVIASLRSRYEGGDSDE
jgi:hypothetical protein